MPGESGLSCIVLNQHERTSIYVSVSFYGTAGLAEAPATTVEQQQQQQLQQQQQQQQDTRGQGQRRCKLGASVLTLGGPFCTCSRFSLLCISLFYVHIPDYTICCASWFPDSRLRDIFDDEICTLPVVTSHVSKRERLLVAGTTTTAAAYDIYGRAFPSPH